MDEFKRDSFDREGRSDYRGYEDSYYRPYGQSAEYEYNVPKKKGGAGKKILTGMVALMCAAGIATGSIAGYKLVTGNSITADNSVSSDAAGTRVANLNNDSVAESTINREDLPTLEQLAAPADALSVPEIIEKVSPSVVGITCITSSGIATGSGIIFSEDGYIITNAHVIEDAQSISVVLPTEYSNGEEDDEEEALTFEATKVGSDTQTDIAVLKIDKTGLTAAEIGISNDVQIGELAIVIGNPLGLQLANTATAGIISAKDRTITVQDRTMTVLQTDASINPGNSGGPLINAYGQVIGITSAKIASSEVEGLGFAIPIDNALPIIRDLMKYGYVKDRPSLGITGQTVTAVYSSYYGIPQGFYVASVNEGSGSEAAGVQEGDIIIAINDTVVTNLEELNDVKNQFKPGDSVALTLYRNGKKVEVNVVLDEYVVDTTEEETNTQQDQSQDDYGYNNGRGGSSFYGYDPFSYFGY